MPCNSLEFAATFRRSLDDDEHVISFLEHDVVRHLDHRDDRHLDDQGHQHLDHLDEHLRQRLDHPDERHHRTEDDHLGHLDEHLDHLDERRPEPKDALVHQFRLVHDLARCLKDDLYVHLLHRLVDLLRDQLDE